MSVLDAVRRPAYTGENRCWPCTAVNALLVVLAALAVGLAAPPAGAVVLVAGLAAVVLRGYVVPYTPRFAPRLVAPLPVDFKTDGGPAAGDADDLGDLDGEAVMSSLLNAGVLVQTADRALAIDESVAEDWEAEMAMLRSRDEEAVAAVAADAAPFEAEGRVEFDGVTVEGEGGTVWLTRPLAIADAAAVRTLVSHGVDHEVAAAAATPLRMFVETCPACGGAVVETTYRDCCGGPGGTQGNPETPVLACEDCEAVLHEFDDEAAAD